MLEGATDIGDGWVQLANGSKVYDPVSAVQKSYNEKNAAQKVESLILTSQNVKKVMDRVAFLEEQMAKMSEEITRMKAVRKVA